jgi:hypothetical protein
MRICSHFLIPPLLKLILNYLPSDIKLQCGENLVILSVDQKFQLLPISSSSVGKTSAFLSSEPLKTCRHRWRFDLGGRLDRRDVGFYCGLAKFTKTCESKDVERGDCCWFSSGSIYRWGLSLGNTPVNIFEPFEIQVDLRRKKLYGRNLHENNDYWNLLWNLETLADDLFGNLFIYLGLTSYARPGEPPITVQFRTFDIDSLQ